MFVRSHEQGGRGGGGYGKQTRTNREGGGLKIAKFERTYFMDDPKDERWEVTVSQWGCQEENKENNSGSL